MRGGISRASKAIQARELSPASVRPLSCDGRRNLLEEARLGFIIHAIEAESLERL